MCLDPVTRPRRVDSVAVLATLLVAVSGAFATVVAAPVGEPATAVVASAGAACAPARSR